MDLPPFFMPCFSSMISEVCDIDEEPLFLTPSQGVKWTDQWITVTNN